MTPRPEPQDVSVVIVSFEARQELLGCLEALHADPGRVREVFVVDNASGDGSAAAVRQAYVHVRLIESATNEGFARANNRALRQAAGAYALLLNPDARLRPGALRALARHLDERPRLAAVGPRTLDPDGSPQVSFGPRLTPLAEWRQRRLVRGAARRQAWALAEAERLAASPAEPDWVSGSCLLARLDALKAVGFLDEDYFLYEEDADLCERLRQSGWGIGYTPTAEVVHRKGASMQRTPARARIEYQRSHLLYYRKHNGPLLTALLRAYLLTGALLRLAASLGPGARPERLVQLALLRLALGIS